MKTFNLKVLFTLTCILLLQHIVFGQTKKQVPFVGYTLSEYKQPVKYAGKYKAYFENAGESYDQGRIVIDESVKTFTIKWLDGEDWTCKYSKKEIKNEHDEWFGDVTNTIYTGKWTDDNSDGMLIISLTKSSGCISTLKSTKVIDADYSINTWKKIFTFATVGKCYDN